MNKSEFIVAINQTSAPYNWSWEKRDGFDECKKRIVALAGDLDEQGLTIDAFKLYKETLTEMTERYNDLFALQRQVFEANNSRIFIENENRRLFKENEEFLHDKVLAEDFIKNHGLWDKFLRETKKDDEEI